MMRFHTLGSIFLFLFSVVAATHAPPPASSSDNNARSVDHCIGVGVVIIFVIASLILSGLLLIYIRHCHRNDAQAAASISARTVPSHGGVDPAVTESFPTYDYSAVKGGMECAICINELKEAESVRLIPKCDHVFHRDCIDAWLVSHTTCPVCRCIL